MRQYHDHLRAILEYGSKKTAAREGMPGSLSLFGYQNRYHLNRGFPILTTKKINFKNIVVELLWFLRGDTNIKYLVDNDCNIWNEDAYNYYNKKLKAEQYALPFDVFIETIKLQQLEDLQVRTLPGYTLGDCGFQYGKMWRSWQADAEQGYVRETVFIDQLAKVIQNIKTKPFDRRKVITAVDPAHDEELALYWCHSLFQFNCREMDLYSRQALLSQVEQDRVHRENWNEGTIDRFLDSQNIPKYYLDCQMYQRSADMFLGVPYNISSYCLLIHIVAKMCNMVAGDFIHTFGDSHIYDNHREQVDLILTREPGKYPLPQLKMMVNTKYQMSYELGEIDLDKFIRSFEPSDFTLEGYESYPAIKAPLSTGLKK
jgi:thymidylate synthase